MADWSQPQQLKNLAAFYEREAKDPARFDDEEFLKNVKNAFWGTDCWSFVEAAFAIIAPACSRRPHLVRELIHAPIDAMISGGLEDPSDVVAQGLACATKPNHYVAPTEEGKQWLLNEWPKLDTLAQEVFMEIWDSIVDDDHD